MRKVATGTGIIEIIHGSGNNNGVIASGRTEISVLVASRPGNTCAFNAKECVFIKPETVFTGMTGGSVEEKETVCPDSTIAIAVTSAATAAIGNF